MQQALLRTNEELHELYLRHVNTVYRVCFLYTRNAADAEDLVQTVFLRLMTRGPAFTGTEHEKAWLLRTAMHLCINHNKHWWQKTLGSADWDGAADSPLQDETLQQVLTLPEPYKTAIYLHYYEGYSAAELAKLWGRKDATVRGYLLKGRALLRMELDEKG